MVTLNLDKIFNPQSVAIIGASDVEGSVGYAIVKNLTQQGYAGKVYFVNIRKPEILGVKTCPTIMEVPEVKKQGAFLKETKELKEEAEAAAPT